jgi:hypothetical protein
MEGCEALDGFATETDDAGRAGGFFEDEGWGGASLEDGTVAADVV